MKNSEEIRKYFNIYDNGNTAFQNQWDAAKEHQRGKFIAIQTYLKKQEKSQISNLTYRLNELEKEEKAQSQQKKRNNTDQRRNKIDIPKQQKRSVKLSYIFFKDTIDKPLARLIRKKERRLKIRNVGRE